MAVKIRLARIGRIHLPIYKIVAIDSKKKRDGGYLEKLGSYDSISKNLSNLNIDRLNYWISVGAILNDSVKKIIKSSKKNKITTEKNKKTIAFNLENSSDLNLISDETIIESNLIEDGNEKVENKKLKKDNKNLKIKPKK